MSTYEKGGNVPNGSTTTGKDSLTNLVLQYELDGMDDDSHEADIYDNSYHIWRSDEHCLNCGDTLRHGVPAEWIQCGNCGEDS